MSFVVTERGRRTETWPNEEAKRERERVPGSRRRPGSLIDRSSLGEKRNSGEIPRRSGENTAVPPPPPPPEEGPFFNVLN